MKDLSLITTHELPPCFALCRLNFDIPITSAATLPQSLLPSRPHSWLPSTNLLTLPWLSYIQLFYRPPLHYIHLYRLCYHSNTMLQILMLRSVDAEDEENHSDGHIHTNIRQSWRTIDFEQWASNHVDVRPASQRRAISPAALFSAAPNCRWWRLSWFFARRHIFSSTFSFFNL